MQRQEGITEDGTLWVGYTLNCWSGSGTESRERESAVMNFVTLYSPNQQRYNDVEFRRKEDESRDERRWKLPDVRNNGCIPRYDSANVFTLNKVLYP
jgi:hypothetical protein